MKQLIVVLVCMCLLLFFFFLGGGSYKTPTPHVPNPFPACVATMLPAHSTVFVEDRM